MLNIQFGSHTVKTSRVRFIRVEGLRTSICRALAVGLGLSFLLLSLAQADSLESGFLNPPDSAKPHTWWHWMSGNNTKEGITADLEAMKRVGIQGAQIFTGEQEIPDGPAPVMSPQFLELVQHAATEAERLGMELCLHNCPGWSSSGGPWIRPEQAMQVVVTSEIRVTGGKQFKGALPLPPTKLEYYRDIAVLAFPSMVSESRIPNLPKKALSGADYEYALQPASPKISAQDVIAKDTMVDLSNQLSAQGELNWNIPPGDWTILRIGHTPRGKENHPAPAAGRGLECDKLSRAGMDAHWEGGIAPILQKLGPLAGKVLNNCLIDSYEVGCNNWTVGFREEFKRRRGYDMTPFLPTLSGRYVESGEMTERFLWDFRRTVGDLMAENYYGRFQELCHQNGLKASVEPYDGPFECLQVGGKADIVMGEFWANGVTMPTLKLAASVAHTRGIPIVGAEAFTAGPPQGRWLNHPGSLKVIGDTAWCEGINRFIFHCYAQQPWQDKLPGMTMGRYGTHFNRNNTWWEQSRVWMSYLARSQHLLQQGRNVADVLFFAGEGSPNGGIYRPDLKRSGYDYDAIGSDQISTLTVEDNMVCTSAGGRYRVLVLPRTDWMTPELCGEVGRLAYAGATILAPKPKKSPSLAGFPACDAQVARMADEVWGRDFVHRIYGQGRIITDQSLEDYFNDIKLLPDFMTASKEASLNFIHRVVGETDIYFVSNPDSRPQVVECAFRVTGREPELWDAATGHIGSPGVWREAEGRTIVTLSLEQAGSIFVVFRKPINARQEHVVDYESNLEAPNNWEPPKVQITRAVYGAFHVNGMVDVTEPLNDRIQDGRLVVSGFNDLAGDPLLDVLKELRVEYELEGQGRYISVSENQKLVLPPPGESGRVRILRATYGKFPAEMAGLPPVTTVDVTHALATLVAAQNFVFQAGNSLTGSDPARLFAKELHVDYLVDGVPQRIIAQENETVKLLDDAPEPKLYWKNGDLFFRSPAPGRVVCRMSSGSQRNCTIGSVPDLLRATRPWEVSFQAGRGAPSELKFDSLVSWPQHPDTGVKYFSGTATYRSVIDIPAENLSPEYSLELDLGRVCVIAEVRLNGKELGTLWKAPFRIGIDGAVKAGANELEVRVTNLWPNRMIGDEQWPDDCEWNGSTIKRWPDWMLNGQPRPSTNRITFVTWKDWHRNSHLLPSGLIGPVFIRTYVNKAVLPRQER